MKLGDLILHGYAVPDGDSYFAIFLELNIYARGNTAAEAIDRCVQFASEYINEAVSDDDEFIADLIPRSAPWRFWARYRLMQFAEFLFRSRRERDKKERGGLFKAPLPVRVAS